MFDGVHSLYDLFMAPLEGLWIAKLRAQIVSKATGRVLEVGAGTAVNLPYYSLDRLTELILTDAKEDSDSLKRRAIVRLRKRGLGSFAIFDGDRLHDLYPYPPATSFQPGREHRVLLDLFSHPEVLGRVHCLQAAVEDLPFDSGQFDTVVATLLFCSVKEPEKALGEVYRVLRPGGQFLFIEHVRPLDSHTAALFNSLTSGWRRIASECHLNRDTLRSIQETGFTITELKRPGNGVFVGGVGSR